MRFSFRRKSSTVSWRLLNSSSMESPFLLDMTGSPWSCRERNTGDTLVAPAGHGFPPWGYHAHACLAVSVFSSRREGPGFDMSSVGHYEDGF